MLDARHVTFFSDSLIPPSFSFIVHLLKHSPRLHLLLHSIEFKIILFAAPTSELFFVLQIPPQTILLSPQSSYLPETTSSTSFLNFFAFSSYPLTTSRDRRQNEHRSSRIFVLLFRPHSHVLPIERFRHERTHFRS